MLTASTPSSSTRVTAVPFGGCGTSRPRIVTCRRIASTDVPKPNMRLTNQRSPNRTSSARRLNRCSCLLLQLQVPVFPGELLAELVVRPAGDELEARPFVDLPRGNEHAVGPQRDLTVTRLARKAHAFIDEPR